MAAWPRALAHQAPCANSISPRNPARPGRLRLRVGCRARPLGRKRATMQAGPQRSSCIAKVVSAIKRGCCLHCCGRAGARAGPSGAATRVARHPWQRVACQLRLVSAQGMPLDKLKGPRLEAVRAHERRRHGDPPGFAYGERCVFVSNDWHAALVPSYLAAKYRRNGVYTVRRCPPCPPHVCAALSCEPARWPAQAPQAARRRRDSAPDRAAARPRAPRAQEARCIFAIHNLSHQGVEPAATFPNLGLPDDWRAPQPPPPPPLLPPRRPSPGQQGPGLHSAVRASPVHGAPAVDSGIRSLARVLPGRAPPSLRAPRRAGTRTWPGSTRAGPASTAPPSTCSRAQCCALTAS